MSDSFLVRVVPTRPDRKLAWTMGLAGGLLTLAMIAGVVSPHRFFEMSYESRYAWLGLFMTIWCLGTLLGTRPRAPYVTRALVDGAGLHLGPRTLPRAHIRGVRAARGRFGFSVAIAGERDVFLEVEREEDARSLVSGLAPAAEWPGTPVSFRQSIPAARWVQTISGVIALGGALGYMLVAGIAGVTDMKGVFGLPAIIAGIISSLVFVSRPLLTQLADILINPVSGGRAIAKHVEVQRSGTVATSAAPARRELERGHESTAEWLVRVDRLADRGGGYREEAAPGAEELIRIAEDPSSAPAARLAAARLLARRHGGLADAVRLRVERDLGPRVRVVLEDDVDTAAERLDRLGPAFEMAE